MGWRSRSAHFPSKFPFLNLAKVQGLSILSLGKLILLDAVLKTIKSDNLLKNTEEAGKVLLDGLKDMQNKFPQYLHSARGLGTFCAIDCDTGAMSEIFAH